MACRVWPVLILLCAAGSLSGCGVVERPQRPAWRGQAEAICLAQHRVAASPYVTPVAAIDGPSICGMDHPFKVTALAQGAVTLNATQTIGCPLTAALDQWVEESVQPVAMARFGVKVERINSMGSLSCRPIDNISGQKYSEHSFGNAIDIGGFRFADGHEISVVKAWTHGDDQEKAFLREVQAGACQIFTTVLAPGSDMFHYNHIHLDLAMHGATSTGPRRICRPALAPQLAPAPQHEDGLPPAPDIDDDVDVSQAGSAGATRMAAGRLDYAAPPAPISRAMVLAPMASAPLSRGPQTAGLRPPAPIGARAADASGYDRQPTSTIPIPPRREAR